MALVTEPPDIAGAHEADTAAAVAAGAPAPKPAAAAAALESDAAASPQQHQQQQPCQPQGHPCQRVHLVVVQHGLWGNTGNTAPLCAHLEARVAPAPGERLVVVNADVNERRKVRGERWRGGEVEGECV